MLSWYCFTTFAAATRIAGSSAYPGNRGEAQIHQIPLGAERPIGIAGNRQGKLMRQLAAIRIYLAREGQESRSNQDNSHDPISVK